MPPSVGRVEGYRLRLRHATGSLTPAERRVADLLVRRPETLAFGTVAEVATDAGCGVATVVRLATKLGYRGFSDLQHDVRADLAGQLRPAADRLRDAADGHLLDADLLVDHLDLEIENLRRTLGALDAARVARIADLLADPSRGIALLGGDTSAGVVAAVGDHLGTLRDGVVSLVGTPVTVHRRLGLMPTGSVLVVCDVRRYDTWVVDTTQRARAAGLAVVALTDTELSPVAADAVEVILVAGAAVGPFDSTTAIGSVLHLLVAATAQRLRSDAAGRLRRIENSWRAAGALTGDDDRPSI